METKLPEDFKAKWVAALRSGEYKQGKGRLKSGDGYCCLAVAGIVCGYPTMDIRGTIWDANCHPPEPFPQLLVWKKDDYNHDLINGLTTMNDSGKTFLEIADYIEKNL